MVCIKLKDIYFNDKKWAECYRDVGYKLSELKAIAKKFYVELGDIEIMMELSKYSKNDIQDAIESNWEPCIKRSLDGNPRVAGNIIIDPR